MKLARLTNWSNDNTLDCLLFFALRIRELVFDYTIDTFKYPALNSTASCDEALKLIDEIESKNITAKSLTPVIEELKWKIGKDDIVKNLVGDDLQSYLDFGNLEDLKSIKVKLELLHNKIEPYKYCRETEKILLRLIEENKQKNKINSLCYNYISSLINLGISQSFIYRVTNVIFFSDNAVDSIQKVSDFFKYFNREEESYLVILKCSELFKEITDSSLAFNCIILEKLDEEILKLDVKNFLKSIRRNEVYYLAQEVKTLDPLSAKIEAERRINKLAKLFVFFHHKKFPDWQSKALVINNKSKNTFLFDDKISAMSKGADLKPKKAAIQLNKLIREFSLTRESFTKYNRAIDLHGISIENKYIENQLLQNWIAFETLLVGYSNKSKIDQVIEHLVPFLKYRYIERIIKEFSKDLIRFDRKFFRTEITKIDVGENLIEKVTALICLEEYKVNRLNYYNHLEKSPLLKWRLSKFHEYFSTAKSIGEFLQTHERKIIWQIKRMYRTRNLIVHAGIIPEYTETLVENSHAYFDILIKQMNDLSLNGHLIFTIQQAIEEIRIKVHRHEMTLKDDLNQPIDKSNFIKLMLNK
ncbi:hypothetical protein [Paludibacter jiangxiensis]|uniref:Apea-like HEPN domain-containing protein n=1 Tax=Paludibacter jiangxiensis TaxID=681398 RepID=A0A170ZK89_9BACT|nr:hypothetical protein [Paludibacter jiangxiensis]GAT62752.1 hypothetical protein PJIAN_355 [Paludibacter jiangxiensis]